MTFKVVKYSSALEITFFRGFDFYNPLGMAMSVRFRAITRSTPDQVRSKLFRYAADKIFMLKIFNRIRRASNVVDIRPNRRRMSA